MLREEALTPRSRGFRRQENKSPSKAQPSSSHAKRADGGPIDIERTREAFMFSSSVARSLAVAGSFGLWALAAPAEAAVFQASTILPWEGFGGFVFFPLSLPQYSGPGTIVGVNID